MHPRRLTPMHEACHPPEPRVRRFSLGSAAFLPHLVGTIGIVMSLGCAPKSDAWVRAKNEDTAEAYRRFLRAEPGSKFADTAKDRMERLDWAEAERRDDARSWGAYLSNHPTASRAAEAQERLEESRWREAQQGGKPKLQIFLTNHPDSKHAPEAERMLDDLAWEAARADDTAASYGLYLDKYFSGAHADEARQFYVDRNWQAVIDADTREAYVDFLQRFPDSRYTSFAEETLQSFQFDSLAIQLVVYSLLREDSLATLKAASKKKLGAALDAEGIVYTWLPDVDARARPDRAPLEGLALEGDQGAMVIEIREKQGRAFEPRGYATDVHTKVHLVPKRGTAMKTVELKGSTRASVLAQDLYGLHLDAHTDFGEKLAAVPVGWGQFRTEAAVKKAEAKKKKK